MNTTILKIIIRKLRLHLRNKELHSRDPLAFLGIIDEELHSLELLLEPKPKKLKKRGAQ